MANELRKLKKRQLLELLVAQGKQLEATQAELQETEKILSDMRKQISGLEGRLSKLGAPVRKIPRTVGERKPESERLKQELQDLAPEDDEAD